VFLYIAKVDYTVAINYNHFTWLFSTNEQKAVPFMLTSTISLDQSTRLLFCLNSSLRLVLLHENTAN